MPRFTHYRIGARYYDKYGRDIVIPLQRGGMTVATSYSENGRAAGVGLALCSINDMYCRAEGRDWAMKHMHPGRDMTEFDARRIKKWAKRVIKYVFAEYGARPCLIDALGTPLSMDDVVGL